MPSSGQSGLYYELSHLIFLKLMLFLIFAENQEVEGRRTNPYFIK